MPILLWKDGLGHVSDKRKAIVGVSGQWNLHSFNQDKWKFDYDK